MNKFERQSREPAAHEILSDELASELSHITTEVLDLSDAPPLAPRAPLTSKDFTAWHDALAAGKQGKFWGFHDKLFASDQLHEDMSVLEQYAKELKLDIGKWKADIEPAKAQVEKDHQEGEKADIDSTPTLYIDGKKHQGPKTFDEIKDWIDDELAR